MITVGSGKLVSIPPIFLGRKSTLPRSLIVYARTLGKIDFFGEFCAIVLPKKRDASKRGVFRGQK
jgi:hypothetical protein